MIRATPRHLQSCVSKGGAAALARCYSRSVADEGCWKLDVEDLKVEITLQDDVLLMRQEGVVHTVEGAESVIALVLRAIKESRIRRMILDNRATGDHSAEVSEVLGRFFHRSVHLTDVAILLENPGLRMRVNLRALKGSSINIRAFGDDDTALHWLRTWNQWPVRGCCVFEYSGVPYLTGTERLRAIIEMPELVPLAGMSKKMAGSCLHRGKLVAILRKPLEILEEASEPPRRLLLFDCDGKVVGVPVHATPYVGALSLETEPEHQEEVNTNIGELLWIDEEKLLGDL
jgi:hypothetical protein